MNSHSPVVSIVLATKNEERNISSCVKSILAQTYKNIEIIVVDNGSIDRTREIASALGVKVYNLADEVNNERVKNYRGAQLNSGVSKTAADIVFFPDADMTFAPELIADCVTRLQSCDALYIPEVVCGRGWFGQVRNFERSFYNQTCIDAVRIVKTDVFIKVGGFDVENIAFGPDDWDFTKTLLKQGYSLDISAYPVYHHEEWLTLSVYLKKKAKYTVTFPDYVRKWGEQDPDIKKQFGLWYRYAGVFLEHEKWKSIVRAPLAMMGVVFIRFLVGIVFLLNKFKAYI